MLIELQIMVMKKLITDNIVCNTNIVQMKRWLLFFIVGLGSVVSAKAQKIDASINYIAFDFSKKDSISYTADRALTWEDFKAKPVTSSDAAAITNAGFGVRLNFRHNQNTTDLVINVSCTFSRNDSWVKKDYKTDYILNHEQKHFDIAFINTMLFIDKLKAAKFTVSNYASVIQKIYQESATALSIIQNKYDLETDHSRRPQKQAEWDARILQELKQALAD